MIDLPACMKKRTLLIILVAVQVGLCPFSYIVGARDRARIAHAAQRMTTDPTEASYRQFLAVTSEDHHAVTLFMYSCLVAVCVNGAGDFDCLLQTKVTVYRPV